MRVFGIAITGIAVAFVTFCLWFFFGSAGAVSVSQLRAYAPTKTGMADKTGCIQAMPVASIDELRSLFPALEAMGEGASTQVARRGGCLQRRNNLLREWAEVRMATQVQWRLNRTERDAVVLNLGDFGSGGIGAEQASKFYFGKAPAELDAAQVALLVGLLRRPRYLDPIKHSDRALVRRNTVLEAMCAKGSLTRTQADTAKALPLELRPGF